MIDTELDIPEFLRRTETPEQAEARRTAATQASIPKTAELDPAQAEKYERRKRRKLRAEAKRLRDQIELIAGRNPPATKKLEAALDAVNRDLYLVC